MSLINQALRKAQQDRGSGRPQTDPQHAAGGNGMPAPSRRPHPALWIGMGAALALLLGLVIALSFLLLRESDPAEAIAADLSPSTTPANPRQAPEPPQAGDTALPSGTLDRPFTRETETAPAIHSLVEDLRRAREASEARASDTEEATRQTGTGGEIGTGTPEIVDWLTRSRINGVRLSPTNSKVILNGEAYAEGDYVNFELGVKVVVIEEARVLFEDDAGKRYMKRL